jgi:RNase P subunit RPR2
MKKKKLTFREKLRRKPCPMCHKKMWKFGSKSSGSSPGATIKWWKCRNCGYRVPF